MGRERDHFIAAYTKANKGEQRRVAAFFDAEVAPRLRQRWEKWFSAAASDFAELVGPSGIASYEQFAASPAGQHYRKWGQELADSNKIRFNIMSELGLTGAVDLMNARKEMVDAMRQAGLIGEDEE